jgi:hypothetical protein
MGELYLHVRYTLSCHNTVAREKLTTDIVLILRTMFRMWAFSGKSLGIDNCVVRKFVITREAKSLFDSFNSCCCLNGTAVWKEN